MANRLIAGQRPFTILAPIIKGGSDPSKGVSGNGTISRRSYKSQIFIEASTKSGRSPLSNATGGTPGMGTRQGLSTLTGAAGVRATGTLQITSAIDGTVFVQVGSNVLESGADFVTAADLAGAIDALEGFNATEALGIVTVEGPFGPQGNRTVFSVTGYSSNSLTLVPDTGTLAGGEPYIGPAEIG